MSSTPPATAPESTEEPAPRRSRRRLLVILAGVLALALGAGAAFVVTAEGADEADGGTDEPTVVEEGEILDVGTLTTNLSGTPAQYARVGVALVLAADADATAVQSDLALVKDAAITEISQHTAADLQGEAGVEALRSGLGDAITVLFEDGQVVRVALTELLVQ